MTGSVPRAPVRLTDAELIEIVRRWRDSLDGREVGPMMLRSFAAVLVAYGIHAEPVDETGEHPGRLRLADGRVLEFRENSTELTHDFGVRFGESMD